MMHLKNITVGNPKTRDQYELTRLHDVKWLFCEDGKNWYEEQKNFQPDTLKIAYDKNGIICCISLDVSAINPEGLSVVEVINNTPNRRADISGEWVYRDGVIMRRTRTPEELQQRAEQQKSRLMDEAETTINQLSRAVRLNMATDEERTQLEAWERYSVLLSRVDTGNPEWPELPQLNNEAA